MPRNTETVLVVDDETEDLTSTRTVLESAGFAVITADHFQTALAGFTAHRETIDAAVLDVSLPGRNGCELARELLKLAPDLKILFVSGYVGAEVIRFYGVPAADIHFLQKPFTPSDLLDRMGKVLRSPEHLLWLNPREGDGRSKVPEE